jgi:DNA-binding NarL/FixJ family response regulator
MLQESVKLAIVDPHLLFGKILRKYLWEQKHFNVAIHSPDFEELIRMKEDTGIDVLVADVLCSSQYSMESLRKIRVRHPDIKVVVLSMCMDLPLISDLLEMGIHGYISKADDPEELIQAIQAASENRIHRNRLYTEALYWKSHNNAKKFTEGAFFSLSEREKRILQLLWEEKSNKAIANELFLGLRSVEKIRQDMKEKVGVKSTIGLLKYAINKKIINLEMGSYLAKRDLAY